MITMKKGMLAAAAAGVAGLALCLIMTFTVRSLRSENSLLLGRQKELETMKTEVLKLKSRVESAEARTSLVKVTGVVPAVDEIVKSLGLGQKVRSIKPSGSREKFNGIEEEAEVQIEKLTMNELVNLFYRFENAPMLLAAKRTSIKTSFENPALLNVACTISLVRQTRDQAQQPSQK